MGIHTGNVEVVDGEYAGLEVHRGARVAAAAQGGQVLLTDATRRAVGDRFALEDLGLHRLKDFPEPARLFHLVVDHDRPASWFPPPRSVDARPTNLPPSDRILFGRDEETKALAADFAAGARLVTLAGPGGIGKTSLALAVARAALADWAAGAWVVWAETLRPGDDLAAATASTLRLADPIGGKTVGALAERFENLEVILVLDNLEHLPQAADQVHELLRAIPSLRVLVTSRTPLRLRDERVHALDPLSAEAGVALLADRAYAAGVAFDLHDASTAAAATTLTGKLDGLPLALELAAARFRVLSPAGVAARVGTALDLSSDAADRPERHRSLRATIEWSLDLLPPGAQLLFTRLAVFSAPASLELIEAVCGSDSLNVVDAALVLVDHSLLRRSAGGLGLVAAIHEVANERLAGSEDERWLRHQHAVSIAALIDERNAASGGNPLWTASEALESEVATAIVSTRDTDAVLHRRLLFGSVVRWGYGGRLRAMVEELTKALADPEIPTEEHGMLLLERGHLLMSGGEPSLALNDVEAALPLLAGRHGAARAADLVIASFVFHAAGDRARSLAACEAAVDAARPATDVGIRVRTLVNLAQALIANERADDAEKFLNEADAADENGRYAHEIAMYRGDWYRATGRPLETLRLYARSLGAGWLRYEAWSIAAVALALGDLGRIEAALAVGAMAVAEAKSRWIDVNGLTQFGEPLPDAMVRWRAASDPDVAAEAERRGRDTDAAERIPRAISAAEEALAQSEWA